jgi:hypothetical protein
MSERGRTLIEAVLVVSLILFLGALFAPRIRAYSVDAKLVGVARIFEGAFRRSYSMAIRSNVYTAIRFERELDGDYYSVYVDGDHDGVRSDDIRRGVDARIEGPYRLDGGVSGVHVGIHPGVPEPPPGRGLLDTERPIRFGRSGMVSFSPLGTASPGTFYIAGERGQAAVRVTPGTARVRVMTYRGGAWVLR